MMTAAGIPLDTTLFNNYFSNLVNQFFKILPLWENKEESLPIYIRSLQIELLGCRGFVLDFGRDPMFLSLLAVLQYLIDTPDCDVPIVKREVFRAISVCNKLKDKYAEVPK